MTLDDKETTNSAFRTLITAYLNEIKLNGFTDIVISISMENLEMPDAWKQRKSDGTVGETVCASPTKFYSTWNAYVKNYIESVTRDILSIVVNIGFMSILQLGEPWWWWQTDGTMIVQVAQYQLDNGTAMHL